jgi:hypothetical protein
VRILTYKRTHIGDPNASGVFGVGDCMGQVRGRTYDAVIGIGGVGAEPRSHGIDGRITWVGVGPRTVDHTPRGPVLKFRRFILLDSDGPFLAELAPELARRMYERNVRVLLEGYTTKQKREAEEIVAWAQTMIGRNLARKLATGIDREPCPRSQSASVGVRKVRQSCRTC